jgi:hypothetical protein
MDIHMDKFYKTEDVRNKMSPRSYTKGERDDIVSNYFTDKRKLK